MSCLSYDTIINNGGLINENIDDSVSVFVNNSGSLVPYILTKNCCELLKLGIRLTLTLKYVIGLQVLQIHV
jgi:hypothetical protein